MNSAASAPGSITLNGMSFFIHVATCLVCGRLSAEYSMDGMVSTYNRHQMDNGKDDGTCIFPGRIWADYDRAHRRLRGLLRAFKRRKIHRLPLPQSLRVPST